MKLLSDQISQREIMVILRELQTVVVSDIPGDVVEFGCYVGTTSIHIAAALPSTKSLYLYDSFEGLPDKTFHDDSPAGLQFVAGELHATKQQLICNIKQAHVPMPIVTKGWFNELIDRQIPAKIAFAFLDGDYYHSVRDPLKLIWPHLSAGATIVVDDYANEALPGASKAVDEWLQTHDYKSLTVESSLAIIKTNS